jgi:hypothetical protein
MPISSLDAQMPYQLLPFFLQKLETLNIFSIVKLGNCAQETDFLFHMNTSLIKQNDCNEKLCIHLISQYFDLISSLAEERGRSGQYIGNGRGKS